MLFVGCAINSDWMVPDLNAVLFPSLDKYGVCGRPGKACGSLSTDG